MKLQLPHFRGGFAVTPNAQRLVVPFLLSMRHVYLSCRLGFCSHSEQNFIEFAFT